LIAEYLYDGDGGRVQKTSYQVTNNTVSGGFGALTGTQSITTTPVISKYVGEMYEQVDNIGTAFIFLGSQRVAAINTNNGTPVFYHGDHLGSTNVMTDNTGARVELIEYDPYGKIQRHDSTSGNSRLAKQQFTGKKQDDETGLVYFGARYYDPSLGRFISPDTIVQSPSDPQTLNRYSYVSNNPVNRVDPDGRSWKKFFKALWKTVEFIHNPVKYNPILNGIVTGDWSYARDMAIAGATGFLFGGPIGAATAMATTAVMRTPLAQWTVENYAHYYLDNVLGMSPRTAYIVSTIVISTAVSLGFERGFGSMMGEQGTVSDFDINNPAHKEAAKKAGYGYNSFGDGANATNPDTEWVAQIQSDLKVVQGADGKIAIVGSRPYVAGSLHTGANSPNFPKALNMKNPSSMPFQKGTTFGFCHQAANATLLKAGFSNTVAEIFPNYSTYATTFVYGNYGGGLAQKAFSGYQADKNRK
jgi:RHS repeat-associated protein